MAGTVLVAEPAGYTDSPTAHYPLYPPFATFLCFSTSMRLAILLSAVLCSWAFLLPDRLGAQEASPAMNTSSSPSAPADVGTPPGLTKTLVYAVLAGQIAAQRGEHLAAFEHLSRAAQLARDEDLAEKAARSALASNQDEAVGASGRPLAGDCPRVPLRSSNRRFCSPAGRGPGRCHVPPAAAGQSDHGRR